LAPQGFGGADYVIQRNNERRYGDAQRASQVYIAHQARPAALMLEWIFPVLQVGRHH
jgi:hypothetical protein